MWNASVRITPIYKAGQIITVSVLAEGEVEEFFCSFIYAENTVEGRRELWDDIKAHHDSPMFRNKQWIIMGDFNEILEGDENSSYEDSCLVSVGMKEFDDVVRHCKFTDLGAQGPKYTWCNQRDEGLICKKLDRFLVNDIWLNKRTQSYGVFEAGGCSDHLRGRFHLRVEAVGKRRPFKFTNAVADMPEFLKVIEDYWKETQNLFQSTSAIFRFSKYLKALKPVIRSLSKEKLGKLSLRVKEAYQDLCEKQERFLNNPTQTTIREELIASERWYRISEIEEKILKQRSKMHWLQLGDRNNKVFHNAAKIREIRNTIREIKCRSGDIATSQDDIKKEAEGFFSEFLSYEPADIRSIGVEELQEILRVRFSDIEGSQLIKPVTDEEIRDVLFRMPSNKAPGQTGIPHNFSKLLGILLAKTSPQRFILSSAKAFFLRD